MKKKVTIILEKEGSPAISVECPEKIKQNPLLVWFTLRTSGFPPLNVNPKDWKGFGFHIFAFLSIFLFVLVAQTVGGIGIILGIADIIFNCFLSANYYFKFIRKKISEGYSINDSEQYSLCEAAGVFDNIKKSGSSETIKNGTKKVVKASLFKDNFGGLIVSVVMLVFCIVTNMEGSEDAFPMGVIIFCFPFSLVMGCVGWALAKIVKEHFKPDVIFYEKTTTLIASKIWWGGGIYLLLSGIASVIPMAIVMTIAKYVAGIE